MLIKMLCGTYGAREGDIIVAKTSKSAPFEVEDKRGRQLVASGYAQEIKGHDMRNTDTEKTEDAPGVSKSDSNKELADYSFQDLKKMAKKMGLSTAGSRQQLIERIQEAGNKEPLPEENQDNEENTEAAPVQPEEEPPVLVPAEPEA